MQHIFGANCLYFGVCGFYTVILPDFAGWFCAYPQCAKHYRHFACFFRVVTHSSERFYFCHIKNLQIFFGQVYLHRPYKAIITQAVDLNKWKVSLFKFTVQNHNEYYGIKIIDNQRKVWYNIFCVSWLRYLTLHKLFVKWKQNTRQ